MGEDFDESADLDGAKDQQEEAAHYLCEGVYALADEAKDEETVNPVPWVKVVYVLGGRCARHARCGHAVAFGSTSAKPDDVVDLRQSEFV